MKGERIDRLFVDDEPVDQGAGLRLRLPCQPGRVVKTRVVAVGLTDWS